MTAGHCQEYREPLDTLRLVEILAAMTVGKAKLDSKAVDAPLGISFKTLFMVALGLPLLLGLSLVETSGGYSLVMVLHLFIAVALLLWSTGCRMLRL